MTLDATENAGSLSVHESNKEPILGTKELPNDRMTPIPSIDIDHSTKNATSLSETLLSPHSDLPTAHDVAEPEADVAKEDELPDAEKDKTEDETAHENDATPAAEALGKKQDSGTASPAYPASEPDDSDVDTHLERAIESQDALSRRISKRKGYQLEALKYTLLVEDRLKALEEELSVLKASLKAGGDREDPPEDTSDTSVNDSETEEDTKTKESAVKLDTNTKIIARIERMDRDRFGWLLDNSTVSKKLVDPTKNGDTTEAVQEKFVLEVLVENDVRFKLNRKEPPQEKMEESAIGPSHDTKNPPAVGPTRTLSGSPHRLRIRSHLLLKLLERITNEDLETEVRSGHGVLIRPFKLLVKYEQEIRDHASSLEKTVIDKKLRAEKSITDVVTDSADLSVATKPESDDIDAPAIELSEAAESEDEEEDELETEGALEHLKLLVQFMDTDLKPTFQLRRDLDRNELRTIAFADLWHLFRYGQEVRTLEQENIQVWRVISFTGGREFVNAASGGNEPEGATPNRDSAHFFVDCYRIDFSGNTYGPISKLFTISRFDGMRDIKTLPIYPLSVDGDLVRKDLLDRSKIFTSIARPDRSWFHMQYSGPTLDEQKEFVDSEVIVDFSYGYLQNDHWKPVFGVESVASYDTREVTIYGLSCNAAGCCGHDCFYNDFGLDSADYSKWLADHKHIKDEIEEYSYIEAEDYEDRLLLPFKAYAFILRTRKWATVEVTRLVPVERTAGWGNLIIPEDYKNTVLALVQHHTGATNTNKGGKGSKISMDLIRGKGTGLIILLHGEPGVGKTSTAECVADQTKRPLYPITCGDIGDSASEVESNLGNHFLLAHRWGCVLLLDEADVFLQRRDKKDLKRNAIVSVFLRTLEYYSGILFLTTNRVGTIDDAFKSRIHVSLLYTKLDKQATEKIWENHVITLRKQYKQRGRSIDVDRKDIMKYAKTLFKEMSKSGAGPWNGRQIRNAFQTALALAEYQSADGEKPCLSSKQFKQVAKASMEFEDYFCRVHKGESNDDRALNHMERAGEVVISPDVNIPPGVNTWPETSPVKPKSTSKPSSSKSKSKKPQIEESEEDEEESEVSSSASDEDSESELEGTETGMSSVEVGASQVEQSDDSEVEKKKEQETKKRRKEKKDKEDEKEVEVEKTRKEKKDKREKKAKTED